MALVFSVPVLNCNNRDNIIVFGDGIRIYDVCDARRSNQNAFSVNGNYRTMRVVANLATSGSILTNVNFMILNSQSYRENEEPTTNRPFVINQGRCGIQDIAPNNGVSPRIVGGTEAVPHSWPWTVFISDYRTTCGASLINNQWLSIIFYYYQF